MRAAKGNGLQGKGLVFVLSLLVIAGLALLLPRPGPSHDLGVVGTKPIDEADDAAGVDAFRDPSEGPSGGLSDRHVEHSVQRVRIVDESGTPIAGVEVSAKTRVRKRRRARRRRGLFSRLAVLEAGAREADAHDASAPGKRGAHGALVREPVGDERGARRSANARRAPRSLSLVSGADGVVSIPVDARGWSVLANPERKSRRRMSEARVDLRPGDAIDRPIDITLGELSASLVVRILDDRGAGIPGLLVSVQRDGRLSALDMGTKMESRVGVDSEQLESELREARLRTALQAVLRTQDLEAQVQLRRRQEIARALQAQSRQLQWQMAAQENFVRSLIEARVDMAQAQAAQNRRIKNGRGQHSRRRRDLEIEWGRAIRSDKPVQESIAYSKRMFPLAARQESRAQPAAVASIPGGQAARSDASGRCRFDGLAAGHYHVAISATGGKRSAFLIENEADGFFDTRERVVQLRPRHCEVTTFRCARPGTLEFHATWKGNERIVVSLHRPKDPTTRRRARLKNGKTAKLRIPAGTWVLESMPPEWSRIAPMRPRRIQVVPGGSRRVDLRFFESPLRLRGRFLRLDGKPLGALRLVLRNSQGRLLKTQRSLSNGEYDFRGVPPGPLILEWSRTELRGSLLDKPRTKGPRLIRLGGAASGLIHRVDHKER